MISLAELEASLLDNLTNASTDYWGTTEVQAKELLQALIVGSDSELADKAWFLKQVTVTRGGYVRCFEQLRRAQYYEAWCELERLEIGVEWLTINTFYDINLFAVEALRESIARWQSLFPYKWFFSPGMLHKRKECSICRQAIDPWNDCGHRPKHVYGGVECIRLVTEAEPIEISLVRDPVQKYSVVRVTVDANGNQVDFHDYSLVRFVTERLTAPFAGWELNWITAFHDHALFPELSADSVCPCESGRVYGDCCQSLSGVRMPHAQILFEKQPSGNVPMFVLKKADKPNSPQNGA